MAMTKRESTGLPEHLAKYPTPFHVFHENRVKEDAAAVKSGLRSRLPRAQLYYSTKTNSLAALLKLLLGEGWLLETVCAGDRRQASLAGAKGEQLLLNGAGWAQAELEDALFGQKIRRVTVDSLAMAELLGNVLRKGRGRAHDLQVALRIHDGNSHFGLPAHGELLKQAVSAIPPESIARIGLHLHANPAGSVSSAEDVAADFRERAQRILKAAESLNAQLRGLRVGFADFGGGIDSPTVYRPHPHELARFHDPRQAARFRDEKSARDTSVKHLCQAASAAVAEALGKEKLQEWEISFEPGRAVCTRALSTVVEVRAVKRGLYPDGDVAITDGNTAILGPLHRGIYPVGLASRPAENTRNAFVYGNLPHSGDWLFQSVSLPELREGDRLEISHTGAYFLPLEANFGLPRPGIYSAAKDAVLRSAETELDPGIRDSV